MKNLTLISEKTPRLISQIKDIFRYREVCYVLILRDTKLRYKQTALGILWVLLQPLLLALVFYLVFHKITHLTPNGTPFFLYIFAGLIPWIFFFQALSRSTMSLVADENLIKKVYFPRLLIPLSSCLGILVDLFITLLFVLFLLPFNGLSLGLRCLYIPVFSLATLIFTFGVSLLLATANVFYRDFKHLISLFIQLWMYVSPIFYSSDLIPEKWRTFYAINPLVGIIDSFRWALLRIDPFPVKSFSISIFMSSIILFIALFLFNKKQIHFSDII